MNREVLLYELRTLRNAGRKADAILEARTRHEKRLAYLNANHQEKEIAACIDRLLALDPSSAMAAAASLEEKYLPYLLSLDAIDSTIMIESFINGKPYWKVGKKVGYSASGVQKRVGRIVSHLSKIIP